ncbi:MAG TPA: hypothetical protein PLP50_16160 [Thermoanaerobaculia bacterium]|mgnify:CR=1 FL=1|jgi:hypothetical protein|nr:hypothetical protein [Thermoanaerobaculia bacterium]HPA53127.1 hypothetical protein [Thermoanaerobaculia bacterium]HQN09548.1 hypothetical protein [Thermoanaerobaculia bacterium]HQP88783.1 hypothetical protein [Thermoanaerobaculia bacterium]
MSERSGEGPGGEAGWPWIRSWALLLAAAGSVAFLSAAALRRLNFDEPLALRAGFLSLSGIPAEPGFAMPFTVLLGALGLGVADPGLLFVLARLLVAGGVLAALVFAFRGAGRAPGLVPVALFATLANATFFVHGLEFRYDAAILVLLVAALPCLVRGSDRALVALGVLAGLLATHHLKGAFFAAALLGFAALRGWPRGIPRVAAGFLAAAGAWLLVAGAAGVLDDVVGLYRSFSDVAIGSERWGPWATLKDSILRDAAWWGLGAAALFWSIASLAGLSSEELRRSPDLWALALAGASVSFLYVHPHPFAYMLALPAPFVGFLAARRLVAARPPALAAAGFAAALALGAQGIVEPVPFAAHVSSFQAPMGPQVEALRWLKARSSPGEKVLDPSGLAYFLPPCTTQWYLDSLFERRARHGAWMTDLPRTDLAGCPWMVLTYRLNMLPRKFRLRLPAEYGPAHPGVALHRRDGRWGTPGFERPAAPVSLENFW